MNGEQLRIWRRKHHLTQVQLAALLEISVRTIKRWEIGDQPPPAYLQLALERLHQVLRRPTAHSPQRKEPLVS